MPTFSVKQRKIIAAMLLTAAALSTPIIGLRNAQAIGLSTAAAIGGSNSYFMAQERERQERKNQEEQRAAAEEKERQNGFSSMETPTKPAPAAQTKLETAPPSSP